MNPLIIAPVILPGLIAPLLVLAFRGSLGVQRMVSIAATVLLWLIAFRLLVQAAGGGIEVYFLGNWPAPFGIVLVLDRLSALMLILTATLALPVLLYATLSGWDARGRHFHALFQFQLMGICGAFLTGDAFNLFVFFEVMLIASYGLMVHSGGAARLRYGVQYMVFNLAASALFLFALGTLYAVTGTLNMADMAERAAELPPGDTALLRVGAVLLMLVFAVKAALVPLQFWLPGTYANAPAPVAALFAVMTKVGAYAILRIGTLIFPPEVIGNAIAWLLPAALLTLALGTLATLGAATLPRLIAYASIASMGTVLIALAQFTPASTTAGVFYMLHSTFATATLFLIADLLADRRAAQGALIPSPIRHAGLLGALFLAGAIAMAAMPPLTGFLGKLLVLTSARQSPQAWLIWALILGTSLVTIIAFARAGSTLFWKSPDAASPAFGMRGLLPVIPVLLLIAVIATLSAEARHVVFYLDRAAEQLYTPQRYITAVLGLRF